MPLKKNNSLLVTLIYLILVHIQFNWRDYYVLTGGGGLEMGEECAEDLVKVNEGPTKDPKCDICNLNKTKTFP